MKKFISVLLKFLGLDNKQTESLENYVTTGEGGSYSYERQLCNVSVH